YLINLFSEILLTYGPGSLPHYVMFNEDEARRHGSFLQGRLNVTPIVFRGHDKLPKLLNKLSGACSAERMPSFPSARLVERYLLSGASHPPARLVLGWNELSRPGEGECAAFSVGKEGDRLKIGRQGKGFLKTHYATVPEAKWKFKRVSDFIYQFGSEPVFAVA